MHTQTVNLMRKFAGSVPNGSSVLDVGSRNVNGSFRELFPDTLYTGIDIEAGDNVDLVVKEYEYPFADNYFDVIISGSTLEHVRKPWLWIKEVARILKPGGKLCVIAPYAHPYHAHPVDCWRIFPDGMRTLFDEAGLTTLHCEMNDGGNLGIHPILGKIEAFPDDTSSDTIGIATK